MPGHPAKYNTAAYEKQNVRGAHVTLEMGIQRSCDSGGIIIVIIIPVPPCFCVFCRATAPPADGRRAGQRGSVQEGKGRATKCWEVMAQHIQALAALWRQINSWPLSYCCSSSNQHQWSRRRGDGSTECWECRDLARAGIYLANLNLVSRKCRYDTHKSTTEWKVPERPALLRRSGGVMYFGRLFRFLSFSPIYRLSCLCFKLKLPVVSRDFVLSVANPKLTSHFVVKTLQ